MKALTLLAALTLAPAEARGRQASPPACAEDGNTAEIAGKLHTCAVCPAGDGKLSVWAPGRHPAGSMDRTCTAHAKDHVNLPPQTMKIKVVAPPER